MAKRKYEEFMQRVEDVQSEIDKPVFKNSLDSDEEDDEVKEENYNVMNEFEGTENEMAPEASIGFTAFNMNEELEEGHFDKEGHYHWNKDKEIRDNWLDDIDWVQIKSGTAPKPTEEKGLADSDSEDELGYLYDPNVVYEKIFKYLEPGETISKALRRLGKGKKQLSTAERWKRKKNPQLAQEVDENASKITKLTELANELLTKTGNMNIYEETYESIKDKLNQSKKNSHPSKQEAELDMYADDFNDKEQSAKGNEETNTPNTENATSSSSQNPQKENDKISWELKWSQDEKAEVHGPHTSEQMHAWAKEGYFKKGAWVRKIGQPSEFYNASRIDFELYCD